MYFWRIARLKSELAASAVGQREALLYLLWLGGITTVASSFPLGEFNVWDYVDSATMILAFLLGTLYLFSCNGGAAGSSFLVRYVSLSWVFGVRFMVLAGIPTIVAVLLAEDLLLLGSVPEVTAPWESLSLVALEVGYYLRLGHHFREVANARAATDIDETPPVVMRWDVRKRSSLLSLRMSGRWRRRTSSLSGRSFPGLPGARRPRHCGILRTMKIATGKVVAGKVVVEGEPLQEGSTVTVLSRESEGLFEATAEQEAELLAAIAEADRGDSVPAGDLLQDLRSER